MSIYKEMYFGLFNSVTDAIEALKAAQKAAEEIYLSAEDEAEGETEGD